jgi:hypothetical protein
VTDRDGPPVVGVPAPGTRAACPWCGADLVDAAGRRCPVCDAVLRPDDGEGERDLPGLTVAPAPPERRRGTRVSHEAETEIERLARPEDEAAEHDALLPPPPAVRRVMDELRRGEGPAALDDVGEADVASRPGPDRDRDTDGSMQPERAPSAGRHPAPASFITEERLVLGPMTAGRGTAVRIGMSTPSATDDGWWLGVVFAHDDEGILIADRAALASGTPAKTPLHVIGPVFAGALSGLIAEENGRQQLRLALPEAEPRSPWACPLLARVAIRWDPIRAEVLGRDELARRVLVAFRRAIEAAGPVA